VERRLPDRKPKYVYRKIRRNKRRDPAVYWYSEPPGMKREFIPYPFMSEEFIRFAEGRNKQSGELTKPLVEGTFHHLADVFRGNDKRGIKPSKQWKELKPRSKKDYSKYIDRILGLWGHFLVRDLEPEMVVALRDSLQDRMRVANYMINVLSAMLWVAKEHGTTFRITDNVATHIARFGKRSGVEARQVYWTYGDETNFLADADLADPIIALGERLLAYSGQRPGDVRAMRVSDYDGEKIQVIQSKTGAKVWVKCHKDLKPYLERNIAEAREKGLDNPTLIRGVRGEPMGERYFADRWDEIAKRTDTFHLNRQDLRRTAVIRLAEAECTVPQIAAITGHSLKQVETILETYFVRTYEMGSAAITKLEDHQDRLKQAKS